MNELILDLQHFLLTYGALGVFLGTIVEEIIAPIPSTLVILGSSFFIMEGEPLSIETVVKLILNVSIAAALGMTLGSLLIYLIGYSLGKPFICKWGPYLGLSWKEVEKTKKKFSETNSDIIALFSLRAIPIVPSIALSMFSGIIRYKIKDYILITFLGSMVRASILGFLGWQLGILYLEIVDKLDLIEEYTIIGLIIVLIVYFIDKKFVKAKKTPKN